MLERLRFKQEGQYSIVISSFSWQLNQQTPLCKFVLNFEFINSGVSSARDSLYNHFHHPRDLRD